MTMERRETLGQMMRFGIVGVIAVAIHYGVYWMMLHWMEVNVAYTIGYLVSFLVNYFLSARFTFREKTSAKTGIGFFGAHVVNYFLQLALLNVFLWLGINRMLAPFAVLTIAVPTNFVLVRFVFKKL